MTSKGWAALYLLAALIAAWQVPAAWDGELTPYWQVSFAFVSIINLLKRAGDVYFDE